MLLQLQKKGPKSKNTDSCMKHKWDLKNELVQANKKKQKRQKEMKNYEEKKYKYEHETRRRRGEQAGWGPWCRKEARITCSQILRELDTHKSYFRSNSAHKTKTWSYWIYDDLEWENPQITDMVTSLGIFELEWKQTFSMLIVDRFSTCRCKSTFLIIKLY